jgi:hypothetical protein
MNINEHNGIKALKTLQSRLDSTSHLQVIQEGGYIWKAHFEFKTPAIKEDIKAAKEQLSLPLPSHYEQFLLFCDGALLYHDDRYGQWGFKLYGTQDIFVENVRCKEVYGEDWPSSYLTFAESLGDADLLMLDTAQLKDDGRDCRVVDGNADDPPQFWKTAARSFSDWLDYLVVAQGAKYWRWH